MPTKAVLLVAGDPSAPALTSVANRPLLAHALGWLARGGVSEAAIVVPDALAVAASEALADERALPVEIRWLEQLPTETPSEALAALSDFLADEPFVLHFADSVAKEELGSLETPIGDRDALVVVHGSQGRHPEGVIDLLAHQARAGVRRPSVTDRAFGGVLILGSAVASAAAMAQPGHEVEAIARQVEALGGRLHTPQARQWWRFDRSPDALLEGNRFALEGLEQDYDDASLTDTHIQGGVLVHPTARLESTTVRGPAVIGPGARVRDAYVGPYTSIGRDVLIEGAEIENSVIQPGASIRHLGGRLEASIVGPNARIFRDFRLPRALRLQVGEGAEVSVA
jgi:glucose-1-phosphate thymidylyltransferase